LSFSFWLPLALCNLSLEAIDQSGADDREPVDFYRHELFQYERKYLAVNRMTRDVQPLLIENVSPGNVLSIASTFALSASGMKSLSENRPLLPLRVRILQVCR
jgi:hypothetical protein